MIRTLAAGALALMAVSGAAMSADAPPALLMSVKIGVSDFKKSTDFYVKYFGMKEGQHYNPAEKGLDWPTAGQGSNVVLVHDPSGKIIKLDPGGGWLMLKVGDAKKIAKQMTDDGIKGVGAPIEIAQYQTVVVTAHDPDGNTVEMLQVGPAK
jgi:catechol 2,3-dioxygenase-like lactoylglutathione lyase family enzyme